MGRLTRDVLSIGAASALLAGAAAVALPATAAGSSPLTAEECGETLEAEEGQTVQLDLAEALDLSGAPTIDLGTAETGENTFSLTKSELREELSGVELPGVGGLGSSLSDELPDTCEITVMVEEVTESPESATEPLEGATDSVRDATGPVGEALPGGDGGSDGGAQSEPPQQQPEPESSGGQAESGPETEPAPEPSMRGSSSEVFEPSSAPGSAALPAGVSSGLLPMDSFASTPAESLMSSAPGLRHGSEIPGYSPEFGLLGEDEDSAAERDVASAGSADALPARGADAVSLPMVLAVLAVSAASAGLVRTWVLRRSFTSTA